MKKRIYVCHTYYHVYVSILKEFALGIEERGNGTMLLSTMSTNFESLKERLDESGIFGEVLEFHEKRDVDFPQLDFFQVNQHNIVKNMIARIKFTKMLADLLAPYVPVDFKEYKDIYVFCDSDPIGYYLNQNKIHYHAVEDGLNCLKSFDAARCDNKGCFGIKVLMSKLNFIFIQNGYGKYCLDMEVNDKSVLKYTCKNYKEVPRQALVERLLPEEKELLLQAFVKDREKLEDLLSKADSKKKKVVILTEELCDLETRKRIIQDLIHKYGQDATVVIKQHPRDLLEYETVFPEYLLIDRTIPMEMLNFLGEGFFDEVIAIFTQIDGISFAKKKIRLGVPFMDDYMEVNIYREMESMSFVDERNVK